MRLLILGGTLFLGRHVAEAARAAGHEVVLFHRGRTNPGLFPDLERVLGDRDGGLAALAGRSFDAVVDTCGYVPRVVRQSARALAGRAGLYVFVSSVSVYAAPIPRGATEAQPVASLPDPATEAVTGETYGPLKALCEDEVRAAFPGRALVVRAGLLVGPHDPTDRFTWWVERLARGGEVLCPPDPRQPVQWIDARDAAAWIVACAERGTSGTFHATGPAEPTDFAGFLAGVGEALRFRGSLRWTPAEDLARAGVEPWSDLPLWVPPEGAGLLDLDVGAALRAGLRPRPVADTVRDTLSWLQTEPGGRPFRAGPPPEREAAVLRAIAPS